VVGVNDGAIVERAGFWVPEDVRIETEKHVDGVYAKLNWRPQRAKRNSWSGAIVAVIVVIAVMVAVANDGEGVSERTIERRDAAVPGTTETCLTRATSEDAGAKTREEV
jgi:hypothetical protein